APYIALSSDNTLAHISRLFNHIRFVLGQYSFAQVDQGLWYLVSAGGSDYFHAFADPRVPLKVRLDCLNTTFFVFSVLYTRWCDLVMSSQPGSANIEVNPLNMTCYMWWDLVPLYANPMTPPEDIDNIERWRATLELQPTILDVMGRTLAIDHIACQEAALHGLGHWHSAYPGEVTAIVDAFLDANPDIPPELAAYAKAARVGNVL
ncbi:MAG: hypothetical protein AAF125_15905, partial [Chloroflexota bacterium]